MSVQRDWSGVRSFCLFVGYARSGHSAIASMIDAHPNATISHELNALQRYDDGIARNELFNEIFELSQRQAVEGRLSSRSDGGFYRNEIPGQQKSYPEKVIVIGDKKGTGTSLRLFENGVARIDAFQSWLGVSLKILHVIRNPYDILSAELALGRNSFLNILPHVARIREGYRGEGWLDVHYEDVLVDRGREIARILDHLGLPIVPEHLTACSDYLYAVGTSRRKRVNWPLDARQHVANLCQQYSFLEKYVWND